MKLLVTKEQNSILLEQIGLDSFYEKLSNSKPDSVYIMSQLNDFIKKSGCQRIEFNDFNFYFHGASLHDRVIINEKILNYSLTYVIYVIFHEIAHQYQYKKYGIDKMYDLYLNKIPIDEGAKWLKNVEEVADEFAFRKIRQLMKTTNKVKFELNKIKKNYNNLSLDFYKSLIEKTISLMKNENFTNKNDVSEILYNNIVNVKK